MVKAGGTYVYHGLKVLRNAGVKVYIGFNWLRIKQIGGLL